MLSQLRPPSGVPAVFDDATLRVGRITLKRTQRRCLFTWHVAPITLSARLARPAVVSDVWSGTSLGRPEVVTLADLPPRSARLLEGMDV